MELDILLLDYDLTLLVDFGYPEAYYTPPLDTVDRFEFVPGGASLMYGPQPGGSLNYVTHRPRTDKEFSFRTLQVFGTDNLYNTFNSVDGTVGRLGYYPEQSIVE